MLYKMITTIILMFVALSCSNSGDVGGSIPPPVLTTGYTVSQDDVASGNIPVGAHESHTIIVENRGITPIKGFKVGDLSGEFSRTTTCADTLDVDVSCNIAVTFTPTVHGEKTATLTISSDNSGNKSILLTGKGVASVISANNEKINLGNVSKGDIVTKSVTLTNSGTMPMTGLTIGNLIGDFSRTTTCTDTLPVDASCEISITFAPTSYDDKMAALEITSTNADKKYIYIASTWPTFQQVVAFEESSIGITPDGTAYAWGDNLYGQLGVGDNEKKYVPTQIAAPNGVKFTEIYADSWRVIAKGNDGKLYAWGRNHKGQLCTGDEYDKNIPTLVTLASGVTSYADVYAGPSHTFLKGDSGTFYACGENTNGKLGINTNTASESTPTAVVMPAGAASFTKIIALSAYNLAMGDDGKLYAWGSNDKGQLGTNDTYNYFKPTAVELPSGVASFNDFYAAGNQSFAKGNDNMLYAWGYNNIGQLGTGGTAEKRIATPVAFPNSVTSVSEVYIGDGASFAKGNDGRLYAWGLNDKGQLGIGNTINKDTPAQVTLPAGVSFAEIYTNQSYTFAKSDSGKLYAWGLNDKGQLAVGDNRNKNVPTAASMPAGVPDFSEISSGKSHTLAKDGSDNIYAWGDNANGQLGMGVSVNRNTPIKVENNISAVLTDLHANDDYTIAKDSSGHIYTWGRNDDGQLGTGLPIIENANNGASIPASVTLPQGVTSFTELYTGDDFNLAKANDGKLYAWGSNDDGQLGIGIGGFGTDKNTPTPVVLPNAVSEFTEIYAHDSHTFAKGNDGKLYAWGSNDDGLLGVGDHYDRNTPTAVAMPLGATSFTKIYMGDSHNLAKGNDGKLYAWGSNDDGTLGIGHDHDCSFPVAVILPQGVTSFTDVYIGDSHNLAKGDDGKLYAWGSNDDGQLGIGIYHDRSFPVALVLPQGVTSFTEVYVYDSHNLAKGDDGNLYAWGDNENAQLGVGDKRNRNVPTLVTAPVGVSSFTNIYVGESSTFANDSNGQLYAWGSNFNGELGTGNRTGQLTPAAVAMPQDISSLTDVRIGNGFTFARGSDSRLYAWGNNRYGQLGKGDQSAANTPVKLPYFIETKK